MKWNDCFFESICWYVKSFYRFSSKFKQKYNFYHANKLKMLFQLMKSGLKMFTHWARFKRIVHELKIYRFLKIPSDKVCMKKGPARHTRTPPSSLPEPNIILILYFLYCPTATRFLNPFSRVHSTSLYLAHHDRRGSPQSTVFYNRTLLRGPAFINSHSVCLVTGTCYCEVVFTLCGDDPSLWLIGLSSTVAVSPCAQCKREQISHTF